MKLSLAWFYDLAEEVGARRLADRDDRRVLQLALDGDRVEALPHLVGAPDHFHAVLPSDLSLDHGRRREDARARRSHLLQQRGVLDLGDDLRTDVLCRHPLVERPAETRVVGRQEERRSVERLREAAAAWSRELRGREE